MKPSIFRKRNTQVKQILKGLSIDTIWIRQPENRRYLSGFRAADAQVNESSGSLMINETESLLLTDSRYTTEAEKEASEFDVITLKKTFVGSFPQILSRLGTLRLGFETDYVTYGMYRELTEKFRKLSLSVELLPVSGQIEQMRNIKDASEIDAIEASADLMSSILDEVISGLSPGMTEKKVAWQIEGMIREAGAEGLAFPSIVASGPNSALPHAMPTERQLREKEPVVFDVGAKLDTYCSDMTRTVFLGDPDPTFKRIYQTVRTAQLAALKEVKAGVNSDYPDSIAREIISGAGFGDYFGHSLGHGVGLATHEQPRLAQQNPEKLKNGMVVTIEPGIYIPGKGGVRLEEMAVIEEGGPRILTKNRHFYNFDS